MNFVGHPCGCLLEMVCSLMRLTGMPALASLPPVAELEEAMGVFCTCVKLAALEKLLNK